LGFHWSRRRTAVTRDMDLIRLLLLKLEAEPLDGNLWRLDLDDLGISDYTHDEIAYQMVLLIDGGLLDGQRELSGGFVARKLTWAGHDFLDSVRDPAIWAKTKDGAKAAGGFTSDLLKALAKGLLKKQIEEWTGIKLDL